MAIALTTVLPSVAAAQTALSFDAAQMRFDRTSRAVSAADHGVEDPCDGRLESSSDRVDATS